MLRLYLALVLVLSTTLALPSAKAGEFEATTDVSKWNPEESNLKLSSSWEFYWHELLLPGQIPSALPLLMSKDLTWQKKINPATGERFGSFGVGTYRIKIHGFALKPDPYELLLRSAATAYRAFIYPEDNPAAAVEMFNGTVGLDSSISLPQPLPATLKFMPGSSEQTWIILIQVSNFHHYRAGLWHPPVIGLNVAKELGNEREGFIFSIGCIAIIGIYNLMIFWRRHQEKATLLLSIFCILVATRAVATADLISYYFPIPSLPLYQIKYDIEYLTVMWCPLLFGLFSHYSFADRKLSKRLRLGISLTLVLSLFILATPVGLYTGWILLIQAVALYIIVITLYLLIQSVVQKKEGAMLSLFGSTGLALAMLYDIAVQNGFATPPFIAQYGVGAFVFLQSQVVAKRFAVAFATAEYLKTQLQFEVERQTENTRSLMEHVPIGIFMVHENLNILASYSKHMDELFAEEAIAGSNVVDVLFRHSNFNREQISMLRSSLVSLLGESSDVWDFNSSNLPTEYRITKPGASSQIMELSWNPIIDKRNYIDRILVTLRDVTNLRQLQIEAMSKEEDMLKLIELLQAEPRGLARFWKDVESAKIKISKDGEKAFALELHTLKGIARALGLKRLTSGIHELESQALEGNSTTFASMFDNFRDLMDSYRNLYMKRLKTQGDADRDRNIPVTMLDELARLSYRSRIKSDPINQVKLQKIVDEMLCVAYYRTLHDVCEEILGEVRALALNMGKVMPEFEYAGTLIYLPEQTERNLRGSLLHLVRNSIYHGFPLMTQANGEEPPHMSVTWVLDTQKNEVILIAQDNGRGLDLRKIAEHARALGILESESLADQEIANLILKSGLSTADSLDEISGRGLGMEAVVKAFEELGGSIRIELLGVKNSLGRDAFRVVGTLPGAAIVRVVT